MCVDTRTAGRAFGCQDRPVSGRQLWVHTSARVTDPVGVDMEGSACELAAGEQSLDCTRVSFPVSDVAISVRYHRGRLGKEDTDLLVRFSQIAVNL